MLIKLIAVLKQTNKQKWISEMNQYGADLYKNEP